MSLKKNETFILYLLIFFQDKPSAEPNFSVGYVVPSQHPRQRPVITVGEFRVQMFCDSVTASVPRMPVTPVYSKHQ